MGEIIKNTNSEALFKYNKVVNGFLESTNINMNNLTKNFYNLSNNWKGSQANDFEHFLDEFQSEFKKELSKLDSLNKEIYKKANELRDLENRRL